MLITQCISLTEKFEWFRETCSSFDEYGYSIAELLDLDANDSGVPMRGLSEGELVDIMNAFFA